MNSVGHLQGKAAPVDNRAFVLSMMLSLLFCSSAVAQTVDKEPEPAPSWSLGEQPPGALATEDQAPVRRPLLK